MRRALLAAAVGLLLLPSPALAPTTGLQLWQAKRIVRANAAINLRPDFRVESVRRKTRYTVKVCWSEPGYLSPLEGRDFGCDRVELRGRAFFLYDDSTGGGWRRWL